MADDTEALVPPQENGTATARQSRCVTLTGFGGTRMLKVQQQPEPTPMEGDVLVRVKAW